MAGPEARDFFTVSEWARRDPAEDHVAKSMSNGLLRHTLYTESFGHVCIQPIPDINACIEVFLI